MRRRFTALALFVIAAVAATFLPATTVHAAELPLGKARFTIAVGGLKAGSTKNWVRLGQYTFSADGKVSETHWHWSQTKRVTRASTGIKASGCTARDCYVQTAGGYQSTAASSTLTGTYSVSGDRLHVAWNGGQTEDWTLTSKAGGALANAEIAGSNYGATHGFGAGSNWAWDKRVPLASLAGTDWSKMIHRYYLWKTSEVSADPYIDHGDGSPFWLQNWKKCTEGSCIGGETNGGGAGATEYYISPARSPIGHRRDTLWGWRLQHAIDRGEYCYSGNSHVKPMLQAIDDNGTFHGWIGVEGSLNQTSPDQGALADDIGVFRILD
ncbi:hypothetical protein G5C51_03470 [Streptomyces sp. A7024]|uniref:Uncharacterized protein n=1 Tax=Streptomyces coryli TaxID=1128680 RepID=A0A6G4TT31_9ACTN|nr:hypothetical protein [Streptomyces coryli]NGN62963.1 hypothetical protein [Streptomyces coryli]